MSAWRIDDDNSRMYRVVLHLHGVDHCMTVAQAMPLLRTAPKMAGAWEKFAPSGGTMLRFGPDGGSVAAARSDGYWSVRSSRVTEHGTAADVDAAMHAADAALRAAGWLLEEG